MILRGCDISRFRNIIDERITFSEGTNVIFGKNAQGKTNLIEALYMFAEGKSFRGARDEHLINFENDYAVTKIRFADKKRENEEEIRFGRSLRRQYYKNGVKMVNAAEMIGSFAAVLFFPEHLSLVRGEPALRRGFLDSALCRLYPAYMLTLSDYNRALKQKNALIKQGEDQPSLYYETVGLWSRKLAHYGAYITNARNKFLVRLFEYVNIYFKEMTGGREIIGYEHETSLSRRGMPGGSFDNYESSYNRLFEENTERELAAGTALFGAHRDDILININGRDARKYASQGQQRSIALAMKLSEGELIKEDKEEYPVFLLDDVLSELDAERRSFVLGRISGKQVIVTACSDEDFMGIPGVNKIYCESGQFK